MTDQELIKIWKSFGTSEGIEVDNSKLTQELHSSLTTVQNRIKRRDLREIIPAVVMIPFFGMAMIFISSLLSKLGALIIVAWCIYLIVKLRRAAKQKTIDSSTSFLDYLKNTRSFLTTQQHLLNTVLYWYILPCLSGCLIFYVGMDRNPTHVTIYSLLLVILGSAILYFNKQAVRESFNPLLERVDAIIKDLTND